MLIENFLVIISILLLFVLVTVRQPRHIYKNYGDSSCTHNGGTIMYEEGFDADSGGHCPECGEKIDDE